MAQEAQKSMLFALRNASSPELEEIVERYHAQYESDVRELISIVDEQRESLANSRTIEAKSKAWFAITLMGDLRSVAATSILIRLIAVKDKSLSINSNESEPHWYFFPAAVALSKIGMPAVEHLMELARTVSPTSTAFQLCGVTLEAILSEDLALAAVEQYARQYPELLQKDRHTALTTLIRTGHKRWSAYGASDFSLE
ncbi:MAG: hypothetical protein IPL59_26970 [Candidatus Competibacteraceae bacterium]|nr:hypothetical protein [Candidatus Competibacteraceae bacterium]